MFRIRFPRVFPAFLCFSMLLAGSALAQSHSSAKLAPVPALLLSDIHFEPFADPGKAPQLAAAPVSEWQAILSAAPSPDSALRFAALQQQCHSKGEDTTYTLFASSLQAMRAQAVGVKFITVSGDLMAHQFDCKFNALFPHAAPGDYRAFAEKTLAYVQSELTTAFPGVPLYIALGNNDSDCGDYQLDPHSAFLADEGKTVSAGFPAPERAAAQHSFAAGGYYSVALPAPMRSTRLLVLNDIFMSKSYSTCAGQPDPAGAEEQLTWLRQQLVEARTRHEKVWVMGHIPPGVNLYSTASKGTNVCAGKKPIMFLNSEELPNLLTEYGHEISLALFGHTHMDELRLLQPEGGKKNSGSAAIALKIVPSISPVHGNRPTFTVAQIDPATAELKDYRVIAASNLTGIAAEWREEYDFAKAYNEPAFDRASVEDLVKGFNADPGSASPSSHQYLHNVFTGGMIPILKLFWSQYACSLGHTSAADYAACVCATPSVGGE
jgi:sphingomyelin phosphodiesterase acid-like 3